MGKQLRAGKWAEALANRTVIREPACQLFFDTLGHCLYQFLCMEPSRFVSVDYLFVELSFEVDPSSMQSVRCQGRFLVD